MSSVDPVVRMTARSRTFSSSRMLPGQGYSCSRCIVCWLIPSRGLPIRSVNLLTRKWTSRGMSSGPLAQRREADREDVRRSRGPRGTVSPGPL